MPQAKWRSLIADGVFYDVLHHFERTMAEGNMGSNVIVMSKDNMQARLIVVLENEQETRDGIERLLKADGYRVDSAKDEDDAVAKAKHASPDLILVTVSGSPGDAIARASSIRERAQLGQNIPTVVFSVQTIAEGTEKKIDGNIYLARPDNFDQLRALFRRLLSQSPPT